MGPDRELAEITNKQFRKYNKTKLEEMDKEYDKDEEQFIIDMMNKNKNTLESLVEVTEWMEQERKQKGEHDTLYHFDDEEELEEHLDELEEHDPQQLVTIYKHVYDHVAHHV